MQNLNSYNNRLRKYHQEFIKDAKSGVIYIGISIFFLIIFCSIKCKNEHQQNTELRQANNIKLPSYRIERSNQLTVNIRTAAFLTKDELILIASSLMNDYPQNESRMFEFKVENDNFLRTVYYPSTKGGKAMCKEKDQQSRELEFRDDWDK
jgi:hypothetical protein